MRVLVILIVVIVQSITVCGQTDSSEIAELISRLRGNLKLDHPVVSDSSFTVEQAGARTFYLNRERPNIASALQIIDSLVNIEHSNGALYEKLHDVLVQFDARYLYEFSFSSGSMLKTVHDSPNSIISPEAMDELNVIHRLEYALKMILIIKSQPSKFVSLLVGRSVDVINPINAVSCSWRRFGYVDLTPYNEYYHQNRQKFQEVLIDYTTDQDLSRKEAFSIVHLLSNGFPPKPIDCGLLQRKISPLTSQVFIEALYEHNHKWNKQPCINEIVDLYKN